MYITALMEGEMGRMRSAGFLFLFLFFFLCPSFASWERRGLEEDMSRKNNIMNLGLGKQAIDFGTESVSKRSLCPAFSISLSLSPSLLSFCTIPTTILPCPKIPIPSQFHIFFFLSSFLFPLVSPRTP